jgi:hypothetical protein
LGYRLNECGFSLCVLEAPRLVRARWYSGLRESWEGHQKHLFCTIGHHIGKTLAVLLSFLVLMVLPPIVTLAAIVLALAGQGGHLVGLAVPAVIAYGAAISLHLKVLRQGLEVPRLYAPLAFIGYVVFVAMLLMSIWSMKTGRGVRWKGRRIYLEKESAA